MTFGTRFAVTYAALRHEVLTVPANTMVLTNPSSLAATVSAPIRTAARPMPAAAPRAGARSVTRSGSARTRRPPPALTGGAGCRRGRRPGPRGAAPPGPGSEGRARTEGGAFGRLAPRWAPRVVPAGRYCPAPQHVEPVQRGCPRDHLAEADFLARPGQPGDGAQDGDLRRPRQRRRGGHAEHRAECVGAGVA